MKYQPRTLNENDLERLLELYKHLHPDDYNMQETALQKSWAQITANKNLFRYFVIDDNDTLITSCCVSIIPNLTRGGRPYALIENVITHPDYRRKGAGTLVIQKAVQYAQEQDCYKIMLLSEYTRKEAHAFYRSLGFDDNAKKGFILKF